MCDNQHAGDGERDKYHSFEDSFTNIETHVVVGIKSARLVEE